MGAFGPIDWAALFDLRTPVLETALRGSLVYLGTFLILRVVLKRETGALGITDLIVIVFIADAGQNAMADDYRSIADGLLLIFVIVFWAYMLDRLAFHVPALERLMSPPPLALVCDGRLMPHNMRKEFITEEELRGQLRLQGIDDLAEVDKAFIEADGRISVIRRRPSAGQPPGRGRSRDQRSGG